MSECPFHNAARPANEDGHPVAKFWPNQLNLAILHQHPAAANPLSDVDYAEAFSQLDLDELKADLHALMTQSVDWWPADYGHYGPFFVRMAWHSAGSYRVHDGRGGSGVGTLRFAPLISWPDNGNLDKAVRLLLPIKQKYGASISWGDLIVLTGNVAIESMGLPLLGFAGGRTDLWAPEIDVDWGPESAMGESAARWKGGKDGRQYAELAEPLGAVQMGWIYVNPEGPDGVPDPLAEAHDMRVTFERMAMNDEETVALTVGGHTFGKAHGAAPDSNVGADPTTADGENMGFGWMNDHGSGHGGDTITSGIEGAWTPNPIAWDHDYLEVLFEYDWELTKSPAGAHQWKPSNADARTAPRAEDSSKRQTLMMTTADIALKEDPKYRAICERFLAHPEQLEEAFKKAWFKLTHRDMGPKSRYLGADAPKQDFLWQDPIPDVDHPLIDDADATSLKQAVLETSLSVSDLVSAAWASASTYRGTDMRGGANGARVRLQPQRDWAVNDPERLARVLGVLEGVKAEFDGANHPKRVSMADLIVLAGCAAVEKAAADAGVAIDVPFEAGRTDASQDQTDVDSVAYLEPVADGFRNHPVHAPSGLAKHLIDRAHKLTLSAPEMTVLVGGLRVLDANTDGVAHGVWTDRPGVLTNDYFLQLLDMGTTWSKSSEPGIYEGRSRATGEAVGTGTQIDLLFGSNSQLRAIAEVYGSRGGHERFVKHFVAAWHKVMQLDRF